MAATPTQTRTISPSRSPYSTIVAPEVLVPIFRAMATISRTASLLKEARTPSLARAREGNPDLLSQRAVDVVEEGRDPLPQGSRSHRNHDGDERDQQAVLHHRGALFLLAEEVLDDGDEQTSHCTFSFEDGVRRNPDAGATREAWGGPRQQCRSD